MADMHEPRNSMIVIYGMIACIAVFIMVPVLYYYFERVKQHQLHVKVEMAPTAALNNLRTSENEALHSYQYVSREKQIVRIPIERAIELETQGSWRQNVRLSSSAPTTRSNDGGTTHAAP